jgi:hypothetical protein
MRNKDSLRISLSQDFVKEITLAEACIYHEDSDGASYHGFLADMIHRTLKELETLKELIQNYYLRD